MTTGKKIIFISLIIFANVDLSFAENPSNTRLISRQIFKLIYNFEFNEAELLLNTCEINVATKELLAADLLWWRLIGNNDAQEFKQFMDLLDKRKETSKFWDTHEGQIIYKSYEIRYNLACNHYISTIIDYSSLKELMRQENSEGIAEIQDVRALYEMYQTFLTILENYYFKQFFSKKSKQHIALLIESIEKQCGSDDVVVNTLSHYFLFKFYSEVDREDSKAYNHGIVLKELYPENEIFKLYNLTSNYQYIIN
ncbi:MAG: hypothetical protein K8R68_12340 [Bacteroidales bacterium]|nr:hypothetical protein [Bacteroidales bacterium]